MYSDKCHRRPLSNRSMTNNKQESEQKNFLFEEITVLEPETTTREEKNNKNKAAHTDTDLRKKRGNCEKTWDEAGF